MQVLTLNNGNNKSKRGDRLLIALTQFDDDFIDALVQEQQALQDRATLLMTNNVSEFERVAVLNIEN